MTHKTLDPDALEAGRHTRMTPRSLIAHALRGGLIGLAELVPGVSGGTIALVTGVYVRIINSANHVVTATRRLVTGPDRLRSFREELGRVEWALIIPLLLGMGTVVATMAGVMEGFVSGRPEMSRGLFMGMVAASIAVPVLLVDREDVRSNAARSRTALIFILAALAAFVLTSQGGGVSIENPSKVLVFAAAAVAICALVLPGISGSFLLLVLGLYSPTLRAVADLDLGYIAVFAAGATLGLAFFVKGLHWLLHHHNTFTMVAMAGLMLGSLRALWPWQDDAGGVLAVDDNWPWVLLLGAVGAIGVLGLVMVDRRVSGINAAAPSGSGVLRGGNP